MPPSGKYFSPDKAATSSIFGISGEVSDMTPAFSGSDPSNTNTVGGLPDRIANGNLPGDQRTYTRWFDASAFRAPAPGTFGNSSPNALISQGLNVHHLGLSKRFRITERFAATFMSQISDIFNTPHFAVPTTTNNISVRWWNIPTIKAP